MELKIIVRECWKVIICTLFLVLILLAALSFAIQYILDGIGMEYTIEAYLSVGTVYQTDSENAAYTPVSNDVLKLLSESSSVQEIDIRQTVSAKIPGMENVPCYFAVPQTNHLVFFRGTVLDCTDMPVASDSSYNAQYANVKANTIYAGQSNWITSGENVYVAIIWNGEQECSVEAGEEYYVFAQSAFSSELGLMDSMLYAYNYTEDYIAGYELFQDNYELYYNTVIPVPDGMTAVDADNYGLDILKARGLDAYIDEIKNLDDVFTIRMTKDMQMLIPVVNETMFFTDGRGIRSDDAGKNVCVISRELAQLQKLKVGDSISVSLGDTCYNSSGYESGFPALGELSTIKYGEPKEYEIVGIYAFSTFDPGEATLLFGYNDIFIPASTDTAENAASAYPYSLSFRVGGAEYDNFVDSTIVDLADLGYTVQMSASRWEDVESTYSDMLNRRSMSLIFALLIFIVGSVVFVLILLFMYRREFALRELFGANFGHTSKVYLVPHAVSSIIASVLSIVAADWLYISKLMPQAELIAPGRIPANTQILVMLLFIVLVQILISAVLIIALANRSRRKSILKLLK